MASSKYQIRFLKLPFAFAMAISALSCRRITESAPWAQATPRAGRKLKEAPYRSNTLRICLNSTSGRSFPTGIIRQKSSFPRYPARPLQCSASLESPAPIRASTLFPVSNPYHSLKSLNCSKSMTIIIQSPVVSFNSFSAALKKSRFVGSPVRESSTTFFSLSTFVLPASLSLIC